MANRTSFDRFTAGNRRHGILVSLAALAFTLSMGCGSSDYSNESDTASTSQALDRDGDGICDPGLAEPLPNSCTGSDNCPDTPNAGQENFDGDDEGDACDDDADGDAVDDSVDNCLMRANAYVDGVQPDGDNDGVGDACDPDWDGDGILNDGDASGTPGDNYCQGGNDANCDDNCPYVPNTDQADANGDGVGDACDVDDDNDGIIDSEDNCPVHPNPDQADDDHDNIGNACDFDSDNDGVCNPGYPEYLCVGSDNCPDRANALFTCTPGDQVMGDALCTSVSSGVCNPDGRCSLQADTDGDGQGDACDPDDDNDGIPDEVDNCPNTPNNDQADLDQNGAGDVCNDDRDGDGRVDAQDNCPRVANPGQEDTDNDGIGDACESDMDGDGVSDDSDNCPMDPNADQSNMDQDAYGDVCDPDMDGDGVPNGSDNCPEVSNPRQENLDGDHFGDACDLDWDGDEFSNVTDNCPWVANPGQEDADGDGQGDACDADSDNDGIDDVNDNCPTVFNPGQEDLDGDGLGDLCDDDADGDGQTRAAGDCCDLGSETPLNGPVCNDQTAASINSSAVETCNALDDNCNGQIDEGVDDDRDGYAEVGSGQSCPNDVGGPSDCDDDNFDVNPGAAELCNGIDDNCDGQVDENDVCGAVPTAEVCDGLDNDLDGIADEGFACVQYQVVPCPTGCGTTGTQTCSATCTLGACVPPAEVCNNGIDDDCNGDADCADAACVGDPACVGCVDADADTYFAVAGCGTLVDCDDGNAAVNPGAAELCNGIDDNCNGVTDEGCPVCGPVELCGIDGLGNGLDDDCNGLIDDGCTGNQSGTFVFTGPATFGSPAQPYLGDPDLGNPDDGIYVNGYIPNLMSWGVICDPTMDTNASPTDLTCTVSFPSGYDVIFQVSMTVPGAPDGLIHYGDMSYTGYGGNGVLLGSLTVNDSGGNPLAVTLVNAPSHNDPDPNQTGEPGELLTYNAKVTWP